MYIRRKNFSSYIDEYGQERYFSSTSFIPEGEYLNDGWYEDRLFANADNINWAAFPEKPMPKRKRKSKTSTDLGASGESYETFQANQRKDAKQAKDEAWNKEVKELNKPKNVRQQLAEKNRAYGDLAKEHEVLKAEHGSTQRDLEFNKKEVERLKQQGLTERQALEELSTAHAGLKSQHNITKSELENLNKAHEALRGEHNMSVSRGERLGKQVKELSGNLSKESAAKRAAEKLARRRGRLALAGAGTTAAALGYGAYEHNRRR